MNTRSALCASAVGAVVLLVGCGSNTATAPTAAETAPSATHASTADSATSPEGSAVDSAAASSPTTDCTQTTADSKHVVTFLFTHTAAKQGFDTLPGPSFAHIKGVVEKADPSNSGPLKVTITNSGGATVATIAALQPGATCGIDHDFAPGDYMVESSDGNGGQFTSFPDNPDTTASSGAGGASASFEGQTYTFSTGGCSGVLDENQFVFRDPATPGNDATYFAITVTDLSGSTASTGGPHAGAVLYQKDGKGVFSLSDATIDIAPDLSGGTFSGADFASQKKVTGSYHC